MLLTHIPPAQVARHTFQTPLHHVVIIVQENRTVDNLFNGYPGANTQLYDPGTGVLLQPRSLGDTCDPDHGHAAFVTSYDSGRMDGFGDVSSCADSYVPASETTTYWDIAASGVFADQTFQTNQGPSFPAHQYLFKARSCNYPVDKLCMAENATAPYCGGNGRVADIDMGSPYPGNENYAGPACKAYGRTLLSEIQQAGFTWRYYYELNLWGGPTADYDCYRTKSIDLLCNRNWIVASSSRVLTDIQNAKLANVSFVTPPPQDSDHPGLMRDPQAGQKWVSTIVAALASSSEYSTDTAVLIMWDDWGGWYDHVAPPVAPFYGDPYEYGFRVPLIVVSPYLSQTGIVDHTSRNLYGSACAFVEFLFGLPSLNQTDSPGLTDNLTSLFNFHQKGRGIGHGLVRAQRGR